jgi:hypothetical protein
VTTRDRVAKLAALFALFSLADCVAELFATHAALIPDPLRSEILDLLPAELGYPDTTYRQHLESFERDPRSFYPNAGTA